MVMLMNGSERWWLPRLANTAVTNTPNQPEHHTHTHGTPTKTSMHIQYASMHHPTKGTGLLSEVVYLDSVCPRHPRTCLYVYERFRTLRATTVV